LKANWSKNILNGLF